MKYKLQPYQIHELGQRQNQEDSMFPAYGKSTSNDRLFILCDGMGGHEKGEVASATVCETMSNTILSRWNPDEPLSDELLQQAIQDAFDALDAKDNGEVKKMGTTMTFLCFHSEGATVAHIGDSRVYQLRPAKDGASASIVFKTRDHSLVNDLIKIGEITEEEAKNHPQKNVITRAMQPCQERRSKADIAHITDIQPGDYFYMCSDGMLEQTSDENLLYIITKENTTNEQKVEMLREVTAENKDNHTAHLVYINNVEETPAVALTVPITQSEEITRIPSNGETVQRPQEAWIAPDEPVKKSKLPIIGILALLALAIAIGAFFFLKSPSEDESTAEETETTQTEQPEEKTPQVESAQNGSSEIVGDNTDADESTVEDETPSAINGEENKDEKTDSIKPSDSHKEESPASKFIPIKRKVDNKEQDTSKQ
ncbi:MAG: serine/threonine-protein phosphatase [Prevotellaceae bacterium]|nr:serine/threonine-protein phosphatase [Candidatus Minthosoma equi]